MYDTSSQEKDHYAINVDELLPMLKLHDVDYVLEGGESSGEDESGKSEETATEASASASGTASTEALAADADGTNTEQAAAADTVQPDIGAAGQNEILPCVLWRHSTAEPRFH